MTAAPQTLSPTGPSRRRWLGRSAGAALLAVTALASGCASMNTLRSEAVGFGQWPAGRAPGSYAFDRTPSQAARPAVQDEVEAAARPALEAAGFVPVAPGGTPDVLVQTAVRAVATDSGDWDDPFWYRGGYGHWPVRPSVRVMMGTGGHFGMGMGFGYYGSPFPDVQREVALLLRDRASGQALVEVRAVSHGATTGARDTWQAMFEAALQGFPQLSATPRTVTVPIPPR